MDRLDPSAQNLDEPHNGVAQPRRTAELLRHHVDATVVVEVGWQPRPYDEARKIALLALLFASELDAYQPLRTSRSSASS